jgi:hypothetical protein
MNYFIFFDEFIRSKYIVKIANRNQRMNIFNARFFITRIVKSFFLLPSAVVFLIQIINLRNFSTVIYRPSAKLPISFYKHENTLVINGFLDVRNCRSENVQYIYFHSIYAFSNFGLDHLWRYLLNRNAVKRLILMTDYGQDHFLGLCVAQNLNKRVWCVQHGLFPFINNKDLDGLDADINLVSSESQKRILRGSGYEKKIIIENSLFGGNNGKIERSKNFRLVFVGCGYNYTPDYEEVVLRLLEKLLLSLESKINLIYRPHSRDSAILKKIISIGIPIEIGWASDYKNPENRFFIGVKSTYMIEAQNSGALVFLLNADDLPKYFTKGDISVEIKEININQINSYIIHYEQN